MPQRQGTLWEGVVAGLIGAGAVAVWFLIVDTVAGRPFYTPAILGSALSNGLRDPSEVVINLQSVGAYTVFHILAFLATGILAAVLAREVARSLNVLWLVAEFFIVFEFGFYVAIGLIITPLLGELAWVNVAIGNLIASVGMGWYLWHAHPSIKEHLATPPPATGVRG